GSSPACVIVKVRALLSNKSTVHHLESGVKSTALVREHRSHYDGSMSAPRTVRQRVRAELTAAILESARRQLAEVGPTDLSLRAISRDLDMSSSAIYRYFPSRDALLTALIIEAYDDIGASVEAADAAVDRDDLAGRWRAT